MAFSKAVHQTISVPRLKAAEEDELWLDGLRREQGCQKRTSYNVCFTPRISENGVPGKIVAGRLIREWDKRDEKSVRHEILGKHKPIVGDHWTAHCAVREGMAAREASPDGKAVFGSRGELERRSKGLSTPQEWQRMRLVPFVSYGDRIYRGNRHCTLVMVDASGHEIVGKVPDIDPIARKRKKKDGQPEDEARIPLIQRGAPKGATEVEHSPEKVRIAAVRLTVNKHTVLLPLAPMRGKHGKMLARAAFLASQGLLNLTFRINDDSVGITFDALSMPQHPDALRPVEPLPARFVGVDRNPREIGLAAVLAGVPSDPSKVEILDSALILPGTPDTGCSKEVMSEAMSAAAEATVGFARKNRCGHIVVENLRNLRGRNGLLSGWARTKYLNALIRFAGLAGIKVLQVWGSYSTTIGNICYDLPDACASAAEMGRRGAALLANVGKESSAKAKACAGGTDGAVAAGGEGTPAKSAASGLGLLPMYDSGTARRGVETIAQAMGSATQPPGIRGKNSLLYPHAHRRKERRGTASQSFSEGRLARLLKAMEQVGGWRELHRALRKARFRTRRPRAVGTKNGPSVVGRTGPGGRGRILRPPSAPRCHAGPCKNLDAGEKMSTHG